MDCGAHVKIEASNFMVSATGIKVQLLKSDEEIGIEKKRMPPNWIGARLTTIFEQPISKSKTLAIDVFCSCLKPSVEKSLIRLLFE